MGAGQLLDWGRKETSGGDGQSFRLHLLKQQVTSKNLVKKWSTNLDPQRL